VATLVLDGAGLDSPARQAEQAIRMRWQGEGVSEVRVGIMADRPAEAPSPRARSSFPLALARGRRQIDPLGQSGGGAGAQG
jgi:ATP-binding protein involved in chromosome partitioning